MSEINNHQVSPVKGKGRGKGRASVKNPSNIVPSRVMKRPAPGRRGRQKLYADARAQAALERQRELKAIYAQVAPFMKPALEDLADRNINLLKQNERAHEKSDAHDGVKQFLDQRLRDTQTLHKRQMTADLAVVTSNRDNMLNIHQKAFKVSPVSCN